MELPGIAEGGYPGGERRFTCAPVALAFVFSTGTQVGLNANIFLRRLLLQSKAPTAQVLMTDEGAPPEGDFQKSSKIFDTQSHPSILPESEVAEISSPGKSKPSSFPEWDE